MYDFYVLTSVKKVQKYLERKQMLSCQRPKPTARARTGPEYGAVPSICYLNNGFTCATKKKWNFSIWFDTKFDVLNIFYKKTVGGKSQGIKKSAYTFRTFMDIIWIFQTNPEPFKLYFQLGSVFLGCLLLPSFIVLMSGY